MPRARCPACDELVPIRDTGIAQRAGKSSRWWQVADHRDGRDPAKACEGSGQLV